MIVKCLAQEHDPMTRARARTHATKHMTCALTMTAQRLTRSP